MYDRRHEMARFNEDITEPECRGFCAFCGNELYVGDAATHFYGPEVTTHLSCRDAYIESELSPENIEIE